MALRHKSLIFGLIAALAFGAAAGDASARPGQGFSFGNRGARTFSTPAPTPLSPGGGAAINRSTASPNQSLFTGPSGGFFSGGFGRGLIGGFLGAGLFGLLFGHGLFGGLGGGLSILGLLLQLGLIYLLFKLVMGFVRGNRPAFQGTGFGPRPGQGGPFAFTGSPAGARPGTSRLDISPADYSIFEQRLVAIQEAYGAEAMDRLRLLATPQMASHFADELAANARQGVVNRIAHVTFLSGDLAEAWREAQAEYATVAMRFSLMDTVMDRASGRLVRGDSARPEEVTEVWTFVRPLGGAPEDWKLSAIQQA